MLAATWTVRKSKKQFRQGNIIRGTALAVATPVVYPLVTAASLTIIPAISLLEIPISPFVSAGFGIHAHVTNNGQKPFWKTFKNTMLKKKEVAAPEVSASSSGQASTSAQAPLPHHDVSDEHEIVVVPVSQTIAALDLDTSQQTKTLRDKWDEEGERFVGVIKPKFTKNPFSDVWEV